MQAAPGAPEAHSVSLEVDLQAQRLAREGRAGQGLKLRKTYVWVGHTSPPSG